MASRAAFSGPSGSTQPLLVTPNTGARVKASAAHSPARRPAKSSPSRATIQVEAAPSSTKGSRTTTGASLPSRWAMPEESHQAIGGWSK